MAYTKKTWVDRQSEYPTRRTLTPTGNPGEYDVQRSEGLITDEGDALNAANLNDLEDRIAAAVADADTTAAQAQTAAQDAMPRSGGEFTGGVTAHGGNSAAACLRNIEVRITSVDGELQSTGKLIFVRK